MAHLGDIYYERFGTGPTVVLVIGFGQDSTAWGFVVEKLAPEHEIILIDNRGCGRSAHPVEPFTMDDLASDVIAVLDHEKAGKVTLAGQSMGGAISQLVAIRRPDLVRQLVLVNSFNRVDNHAKIAFEGLYQLLESGVSLDTVVTCLVPWVYSSEFLALPGCLDSIIQAANTNPYPQPVHSYRNQLDALAAFDSTAHLANIQAPTLILAGQHDVLIPMSAAIALSNNIKRAHLQVINSAHGGHIELPDEVASLIHQVTVQ